MSTTTTSGTGPRARWRWRDALWIVLALIAVVALRKGESSYEQRDAPLVQRATGLGRAEGRNFAVDVSGFKAARAYLLKGGLGRSEDMLLRTPGLWLSVVATVEATQRPGYVQAQLRTRDGLVYAASSAERPKLRGVNLSERPVAPGLPENGAWFFELPADRLEGAHLQLYWGSGLPQGGDTLLDVDLGIDAARARKLLAEAKPVLDLR